MCRHAGFRWGGAGWQEPTCGSGVHSGEAALGVVRFVLCILLICIIVVPVPFVCCSVKLPLSPSTSFCLFLSILLRNPAGGGAATWRFCCLPQPNQNTIGSIHVFTAPRGTCCNSRWAQPSLAGACREQLGSFHAACCDLECLKERRHDLQPCPAAVFRACPLVCTHMLRTAAALPRSWFQNLERFH